jgi:WD40 repeat protein
MKEHENSLTPEALDGQTELWSGELSLEEHRLIQDLYASSRAYSQENQRSLERIWSRFLQGQEKSVFLQEQQSKEPDGKQLVREGKAMQENEIYQETHLSMPNSRHLTRPRRPLWRTLSMSVAAAVVLITILSWVVLSYGLRDRSQHSTANNKQTTQTSVAQKDLSSGTLLCSFSDDNSAVSVPIQPSLDWSKNRQIATTYNSLKTFSPPNCTLNFSSSLSFTQATWAPDGEKLLVLDGNSQAEVLDASTGRAISSFNGGGTVDQSAWIANGTQIVSAVTKSSASKGASGSLSSLSVQVWNASSGALIRTALTFAPGVRFLGQDVGQLPLSPDGKDIAIQKPDNTIEVWDIGSGKLVSSIPYHESDVSALAWSPGDASLAIGLFDASEVQIWSATTGQLRATFQDTDTWAKIIGALAWSANGKYLAQSGSDIHIWDADAQKIVATFGRVDKAHFIATLAWSPNSSMLVSSTNHILDAIANPDSQNTVNVWKLS